MKKYILSVIAAATALTACQDDWNAHYDQLADSQYGTESIYEIIASRPELSDFKAVLDSARVFAGNRISATHYCDLLAKDQFLTVWAPVNGTFDRDSLLRMCQTANGDSLVELHFLKNHIARYAQSSVANVERSIKTLNAKTIQQMGQNYGDAVIREANIASRNGVLHILNSPATYRYNIYEALFSLPQFRHIGNFLQSYQIDEFDEENSLAMGVVDGKTVYVDSVFYSWNKLLQRHVYGHLDKEDSTYWMLVPDREQWEVLYEEASKYYQFGNVNKTDSLHDYWTNYALLQDLSFNPHEQLGLRDSLCSTTWSAATAGRYHVYYDAFGKDGLFSHVGDSLQCSNGQIYMLRDWPFTKQKTYFRKIEIQSEGRVYESNEGVKGKTLNTVRRYTAADSVSGGGYLHVTPQTVYDPYYITYEVPNVLSGTYDVCVVMLPKTVYNPSYDPNKSTDKKYFRPNKFIAEITYSGLDGREYQLKTRTRYKEDPSSPAFYEAGKSSDTSIPYIFECDSEPNSANNRAFTNDPFRVDTIRLATVHFPTCNYDQQKITTRIKIINDITNKQTSNYNAEMLLDCVLLLPNEEK